MQTALDDSTLNQVLSIVSEVSAPVGDTVDQDHLLMFTCLQLAYSLEKISRRLENLEERLNVMGNDASEADRRSDSFYSESG
jgi:hypothetical protein